MVSQPDDKRLTVQLSDRASMIVRERAQMLHKDEDTLVSEMIEETQHPVEEKTIEDRLAAFEEFARSMREWGERNLPPGHRIDDSRESIYEGCGE